MGEVLKDGDFMLIVIDAEETEEAKEEKRQEGLEEAKKEIQKRRKHVAFAEEVSVRVVDKPSRQLILDGNSLTPLDLVYCEGGDCILHVSKGLNKGNLPILSCLPRRRKGFEELVSC